MQSQSFNSNNVWKSFLIGIKHILRVAVWILKALGMILIAAVIIFVMVLKFFSKIGDDLEKERRRRRV